MTLTDELFLFHSYLTRVLFIYLLLHISYLILIKNIFGYAVDIFEFAEVKVIAIDVH